jgi:hypothetical protein
LAVAVEWRAARRFVVVFPAAFPAADASSVLDDTRVECFARCLTTFWGAASAIEPRVHTATTATSSIFIVLRIMESLSSRIPAKTPPSTNVTIAHLTFQFKDLVVAEPAGVLPLGIKYLANLRSMFASSRKDA